MDPRGWYGGTFIASIKGCNIVPWWRTMCRHYWGDCRLPDVPIAVGKEVMAELLMSIVPF